MDESGRKSRRKAGVGIWLKRGALALIAPLIFLGAAEVILRVIGFGYPTSYFVSSKEDPQRLVENPHFGRRFFPAGLLRVPPPTRFLREKQPGTIRIFIFGESAAMGDPKPAFGVARYLEVLLEERYPGVSFEVIPAAMTAINSHALLSMARECADLGGDYWIVFAGNNEMLGPFGAGSVLGQRAPPVALVRLILAAKTTRLGQGMEVLIDRLRGRGVGSSQWAGIRVLAGDVIRGDAPERARVYSAFERNLRDLVAAGQQGGAEVLLSTVTVNLKDCAPFGAEHRSDVDPAALSEWERSFREAQEALQKRDFTKALESSRKSLTIDDGFATGHFVAARALIGLTNLSEAATAFARARDLDTIPLRTDGPLNAITRRVAESTRAGLIDAEKEFGTLATEGTPGGEFFYEHVHLRPEGNYQLARLFAESLAGRFPESVGAKQRGDWPVAEVCDTRLALTPWARASAGELMLARCLDAPFTNRLNNAEQVKSLAEDVARQRRAGTPETASFVRGIFTNNIANNPSDYFLQRSYAEFLSQIGDVPAATAEWHRVRELLPHHPLAYLEEGKLLRRAGRLDEAQPLIETAISMQPDWVDAHLELGEVFLVRGRPADALDPFRTALQLQPTHARAYMRFADALAADRQRDAAITNLEHAIRLDPGLWEGRYLLGVEYAMRDDIEAAREQFAEVVRLKPDHARAQFNLGIALARQQAWKEASMHLAEAIRLDPKNQDARQALAQIASMHRQELTTEQPPQGGSGP